MGSTPAPFYWSYVLTGEVRSGAGVVLTSLNARPGAVCHADLFHPDPARRRAARGAYFGPPGGPGDPGCYQDGRTTPGRYLEAVLRPRRGERSVGVHVPYAAVRALELYDWFARACREGGFGVVHVVRNPLACFVSFKQAAASGVWGRRPGEAAAGPPPPVYLDPAELTAFCRDSWSVRGKLRSACTDYLEVHYRDLLYDYQGVMRRVFDHVELPDVPDLARPGCLRLRNRVWERRVSNWDAARAAVPGDVRALFDADDLV